MKKQIFVDGEFVGTIEDLFPYHLGKIKNTIGIEFWIKSQNCYNAFYFVNVSEYLYSLISMFFIDKWPFKPCGSYERKGANFYFVNKGLAFLNPPFTMHKKLKWLVQLNKLVTTNNFDPSFLRRAEHLMMQDCFRLLDHLLANQSEIEDGNPNNNPALNPPENDREESIESTPPACEEKIGENINKNQQNMHCLAKTIPELDDLIVLQRQNMENKSKSIIQELMNIPLTFNRSHDSNPLHRLVDEDFKENEKKDNIPNHSTINIPLNVKIDWMNETSKLEKELDSVKSTGRAIHHLYQARRP